MPGISIASIPPLSVIIPFSDSLHVQAAQFGLLNSGCNFTPPTNASTVRQCGPHAQTQAASAPPKRSVQASLALRTAASPPQLTQCKFAPQSLFCLSFPISTPAHATFPLRTQPSFAFCAPSPPPLFRRTKEEEEKKRRHLKKLVCLVFWISTSSLALPTLPPGLFFFSLSWTFGASRA